ncbi:MAG: fibrobacter succinogenes major paralogous domain-containing protein, partial [Bacteroidales bacterium]|nr:fibrobacter succinogenes major paralogous domain-containing protein [Bacteroidales bacterium]
NYGTHNVETETACESYDWHGTTYTVSGEYTYAYTNGEGCASVDTLKLTVNYGTHNVETETACESYDWHGTTYTVSGEYTYSYTNADGCASVDTLKLTINPQPTLSITNKNQTLVYGADVETAVITNEHSTVSYTLPEGFTATTPNQISSLGLLSVGTYEIPVEAVSDQTPNCGTLYDTIKVTVNPRNVVLTSATETREYNGDVLTNSTVTVTGDGFVTGEGATYDVTGQQLLPGSSDNTFTYTLNSGTLAGNYNITTVFGVLTVTDRTEPYAVTMTSNSNVDPIIYDGLEHTIDEFVTHTFTENGHTYTVSGLTASVTEIFAGTYENAISGTAVVTDEYGNDVTSQFTVNNVPGALTISKRQISITIENADDATKMYDGTPLTVTYDQLHIEGLAETDMLIDGTITTSDYVVGEYPIEDGNMFYMMSAGTSIKSGFKVKHVSGELLKTLASYSPSFYITLGIYVRPLTITATSGTKPYDGTALVGSYTSEGLAVGDVLNATVNGSQLCVGESANEVTAYNVTRSGVDVTDQYTVTTVGGLLEVTPVTTSFACPAAVTLAMNDCDDNIYVTESQLGTPTHALISAGVATATSDLTSLNPMTEGMHTVTWSLLDNCGNVMATCMQLVTLQRPACTGVTYKGHPYPAVQIGSQCWLAENLRNEEDAAGNAIANYRAVGDDPANVDKYGYLYSWYSAVGVAEGNDAVMPATQADGCGSTYVQGICPDGWAIPSQEDVNKLRAAIEDNASVLKTTDPQYWIPGSAGVTPNTDFNAKAEGLYNSATERFEKALLYAYFWESDSELNVSDVLSAVIAYYCDNVMEEISPKADLRPVRCVRKVAH